MFTGALRQGLSWRWLVPIGLALIAATLQAVERVQFQSGVGIGFVWLWTMLLASPTILYYRLLIFIGERLLPRWRHAAALSLVLAGALLPPLLHNRAVDKATEARDFVGPVPPGIDTIALDDGFVREDLLQHGFVSCDETCLRLLFGGAARRVVVGDASAQGDVQTRSMRGAGEPATYPTAQVLRIERRPVCPPVTSSDNSDGAPFPGGPVMSPWGHHPSESSIEDRAIALIASGQCLVAEPGSFRDAGLRLGSRVHDPSSIQPNDFGLLVAEYRFVERREGSGWIRSSQRVERGGSVHWLYPFALLPNRFSWFAAEAVPSQATGNEADRDQPWRWAGITLPTPAYPGEGRLQDLLDAALALPADAPRDARHQLARQYLRRLSRRRPDAADRARLLRIVADPRVRAWDLQPLDEVARSGEAVAIGQALLERMGRIDPRGRELRLLSYYTSRLPRDAWPALLPELRRLAADPERAGEAQEAFKLFAAGDESDAAFLLGLFRRNWPPLSLANTIGPTEAQQRASLASAGRVQAYLIALCAVPDRSGAIRTSLIAASRDRIPQPMSGDGSTALLWQTIYGMGIPVARLAEERSLGQDERREIARLAQSSGLRCAPRNPPSSSPPTSADRPAGRR